MRGIVIGASALLGLLTLMVLVGMTRPKGHVARTRALYSAAPEVVWATVSDFQRWPEWNPEVRSVERTAPRNGHEVLKVVGSWGEATTELAIWDPPRELRTEMDAGGFRGAWSYELSAAPQGGTLLVVTEEGEVDNPLFRAMMIFHDNHATMVAFHRALGSRLGQSVEPERVAVEGR